MRSPVLHTQWGVVLYYAIAYRSCKLFLGANSSVAVPIVHHYSYCSPMFTTSIHLSCTELRENSLFKSYSRGEPSMRLYIKNLAKQVTEKVGHPFTRHVLTDIIALLTVIVHMYRTCTTSLGGTSTGHQR